MSELAPVLGALATSTTGAVTDAVETGAVWPVIAAVLVAALVFLWRRALERSAARTVAGNLNLTADGSMFADRIEGTIDGIAVHYQTRASNEVGKGACLELEWARKLAPVVVIGPKSLEKRVEREATRMGATVALDLHDDLVAYTDHVARPLLQVSRVREAITSLAVPDAQRGKPGALIIGSKIVSARGERFRKPHELRGYLNSALQVASLLSGRR